MICQAIELINMFIQEIGIDFNRQFSTTKSTNLF